MADLSAIMQMIAMDPRWRDNGVMFSTGGLIQAVAASTSYTLFTRSSNRAVWLYALHVYNDNDSLARISIGTGDFTANMPQFGPVLSDYSELFVFPPREFRANIVAQSTVGAASPSEVEIQAYVFEVR